MEFKNEILSSLLRIITPRMIAELSTNSETRKKVSLSSLVETYCEKGHYKEGPDEEEDETKAKILSFSKKEESEKTQDVLESSDIEIKDTTSLNVKCSKRVESLFKSFSKRCQTMDKSILGLKRLPKKKMKDNVISLEDVLDQKRKYAKSNNLIKSKQVLELYKSTSSQSVSKTQPSEKEDEFACKERGILINKKQA